ncbi:MAG: AAA family ATPase [Pirellulales bacterium]
MMKAQPSVRDTASFQNGVLPAILNEDAFWPAEPSNVEETGLSEVFLETLMCQLLLGVGSMSGRKSAERLGLPYAIIEPQLAQLRVRQLVTHARSAPLNDYYYSLTENGQRRAQAQQKLCSYSGPAPVPLIDYVLSVEAQSSHFDPITRDVLIKALQGVTFEPAWLDLLGPAINSNAGVFLYGPPGNGKTTLAKCLTACRSQEIWIPHAIIDDGMIIKLFDASYHQAPSKDSAKSLFAAQEFDRRWVRIRRPTVVVGGELTLDNLEIRHDPRSNTCEAPLQMKSNCGCLLIDDFGRQRVAPAELLNRWIVPLESRNDFLTLPTGKKISVPFQQIILFSTNLQPEELVDEAFMRRVPFKIEIGDPSQAEFVEIFRRSCEALGFTWRPDVVEQLLDKHYRSKGRNLRRCHPRDLLQQVKSLCVYRGERPDLRIEFLDLACKNYFGASPLPGQHSANRATPSAAKPLLSVPLVQPPLAELPSLPSRTQPLATPPDSSVHPLALGNPLVATPKSQPADAPANMRSSIARPIPPSAIPSGTSIASHLALDSQ